MSSTDPPQMRLEYLCKNKYSRGASQAVQLVRNPPANAGDIGDLGLIPGLGRSPGDRNGNPLQYASLEKSMDRGAQWAAVHGVAKSQTRLSD